MLLLLLYTLTRLIIRTVHTIVKLLLVATHLTPHIYDIGSKATPGFGIGLPPTATLHTLNSLLTLN